MYYQLTFKVEGEAISQQPYEIFVEPYHLKVITNKDQLITNLCISKKVIEYKDYLPILIKNSNNTSSLTIPKNPYDEDIINLSQHIESLGSFWLGIHKIHWNFPVTEWIPENDEEKKLILVNHIDLSMEYELIPMEMLPNMLKQVVEQRNLFKDLVIPLSFMREGKNEFSSFRYINAFYNFYYYLEDLYGMGKTKNYQVEEAFRNSIPIRNAIETTLKRFNDDGYEHHIKTLQEFLRMENCNYDTDGIIKLIVTVRGNLHHFSQKSSKKKGHPLNHKDFETISYLLMGICINTFSNLIISRTKLN